MFGWEVGEKEGDRRARGKREGERRKGKREVRREEGWKREREREHTPLKRCAMSPAPPLHPALSALLLVALAAAGQAQRNVLMIAGGWHGV